MIDFTLHPNVYSTGRLKSLRSMLEETWVRTHNPGDGTFYIISGFSNFNGGARFYRTFKEHTENGGQIKAFLGGNIAQRQSSKQVVEALLDCGADVQLINRKSIMHAKCYGTKTDNGETLIITSGNFTGPGMTQNVEAALFLGSETTASMNFSWDTLTSEIIRQNWMVYHPLLANLNDPAWQLLYDETPGRLPMDESEAVTLVVTLGHSDTVRIQSVPGAISSKGTQYFWLSKDSFDFFPPLTYRNQRGFKGTLSALITMRYIDLGIEDPECRVTFEAENNLDFRLGTGKLRNTRIADNGDLACISRIGEAKYELRIIKQNTDEYSRLRPYGIHFIGHQGKMYGYLDNQDFEKKMGIRLGN